MNVKRNFFSDHRKSKLIALEALAVTCLFHFALLTALVYEPSPANMIPGNSQTISLMNLANPAVANAKEIMNWLEYHDPSLLVRADHAHSYSEMARRPAFRASRGDLPRPPVLDEITKPEPAGFEPLAKLRPIEQYATPFVGYAPTPPPPRPHVTSHSQSGYPQVLRSGFPLKINIPEALTARAGEIDAPAIFRARLTRYNTALFPRYELVASSGNVGFDREIMNFILARSDELLAGDTHSEITIIWNNGEQK